LYDDIKEKGGDDILGASQSCFANFKQQTQREKRAGETTSSALTKYILRNGDG
jgi:hypothetical protein